jgi:hypothetical protein
MGGAQRGDTARQFGAVGEGGAGRWPRARRRDGNGMGRHGRKMGARASSVHRENRGGVINNKSIM